MNRFNSTIKQKTCKCGCHRMPTISCGGYNYICAPAEIKEKLGTRKALNDKNRAKRAEISRKIHLAANGTKSEIKSNVGAAMNPQSQIWAWFVERRKEMTNTCLECGRGTQRSNDKFFHWQICHIVPKSLVPSVATHKHNWVELCWLHHQTFDSSFDKAASMMCFGEVKQKFQLFKHLIPPEELRKINPNLLSE